MNVSMVGGFFMPEVDRLMHALMVEAREMNPDVLFPVSFSGKVIATQRDYTGTVLASAL